MLHIIDVDHFVLSQFNSLITGENKKNKDQSLILIGWKVCYNEWWDF